MICEQVPIPQLTVVYEEGKRGCAAYGRWLKVELT